MTSVHSSNSLKYQIFRVKLLLREANYFCSILLIQPNGFYVPYLQNYLPHHASKTVRTRVVLTDQLLIRKLRQCTVNKLYFNVLQKQSTARPAPDTPPPSLWQRFPSCWGGTAFPAPVWGCFVTQIPFTFVVQVCTYRQSAWSPVSLQSL